MHLRLATFSVNLEAVDHFQTVTLQHVGTSQQEAGIVRFELMQSEEDPRQFALLMLFQDDSARIRHMTTEHFQAWRETIAPDLAEPIRSVRYRRLDSGGEPRSV
jgi:autoinducer 2-degrading protein